MTYSLLCLPTNAVKRTLPTTALAPPPPISSPQSPSRKGYRQSADTCEVVASRQYRQSDAVPLQSIGYCGLPHYVAAWNEKQRKFPQFAASAYRAVYVLARSACEAQAHGLRTTMATQIGAEPQTTWSTCLPHMWSLVDYPASYPAHATAPKVFPG